MNCTLNTLKERISEETIKQLTDDENLGIINQGRVDAAINSAYAKAYSYFAVRYTVPFAVEPESVTNAVADVAVKFLYSRKVEKMPEERQSAFDTAIAWFKDVAKGVATLGVDPAPAATTEGGAETNITTSDRIFTKDSMGGF